MANRQSGYVSCGLAVGTLRLPEERGGKMRHRCPAPCLLCICSPLQSQWRLWAAVPDTGAGVLHCLPVSFAKCFLAYGRLAGVPAEPA